jgi:hypothetical protein
VPAARPGSPAAGDPHSAVEQQPPTDVAVDERPDLPQLPDPVAVLDLTRIVLADLVGEATDERPRPLVQLPADLHVHRHRFGEQSQRVVLTLGAGAVPHPDRAGAGPSCDVVDHPLLRDRTAADGEHWPRQHVLVTPRPVHERQVAPGIVTSAQQRGDGGRQRRVTQPGVAVVELPVVPCRLRQGRGRCRHDRSGGPRRASPHDGEGVARPLRVAARKADVLQALVLGCVQGCQLCQEVRRISTSTGVDRDDQRGPGLIRHVESGDQPGRGHLVSAASHGQRPPLARCLQCTAGLRTVERPVDERGVEAAEAQSMGDEALLRGGDARSPPQQAHQGDSVAAVDDAVADVDPAGGVPQHGRRARRRWRVTCIDVLEVREPGGTAVGVQQPPAQWQVVELRGAPPLDSGIRRQHRNAPAVADQAQRRQRRCPGLRSGASCSRRHRLAHLGPAGASRLLQLRVRVRSGSSASWSSMAPSTLLAPTVVSASRSRGPPRSTCCWL